MTHQSASPTWLARVSADRVHLADVQLYVFCRQYRQQSQRCGRAGAFEIKFVSSEGRSRGRLSSGAALRAGKPTLTLAAARQFRDFFYSRGTGPAEAAEDS